MVDSTVTEDRDSGVWLVRLHGVLRVHDAVRLAAAVEEWLAHCPAAIVVDLHGVTDADDLAMRVLPALHRRALLAEVPLVYACGPTLAGRIRDGLAGRMPPVHATAAQAREAALGCPGRRWLRLHLPSAPLTSSTARTQVGDACVRWRLPNLLHPVRLLVSELVDNAVEHAGTDVEVTAGVLDAHLHLRVRDGSRRVPVLCVPAARSPRRPLDLRGQGLRRLARYTAAWGTVRQSDGKTVWAILPLP